jgi:hypothetical protein
MKKLLLIFLSVFTVGVFAQQRAHLPASLLNLQVKAEKQAIKETSNMLTDINHYVASYDAIGEAEMGYTIYDLQSNATSPCTRFYIYPSGEMAAVWTYGTGPSSYSNRGTGYNYYDGTSWGPEPTARVETQRAGWTNYAPLGTGGEIVCTHHNTAGLIVNRRSSRGAGAWTESILPGPAGAVDISWPRLCTSGTNRNNVHVIASTYSAYAGQNLALLYYRSTDGGVTWDKNHVIPEQMSSTYYAGFSGDVYSWAEPKGDTIAFIVNDSDEDLFVMRSPDNGETWEKIVIWQHPDPLGTGTPVLDSLWGPDGAAHLTFDKYGKLHVVFGVYKSNPAGGTWYPYSGGVAYWNEDMPTWTGGTPEWQINCLNPDSLYESGNLIGYPLDLDGNGVFDVLGEPGLYYVAVVSMPQITIDENGDGMVAFAGITENLNNGVQDYRHLWARSFSNFGETFGQFVDLTGDDVHMFDECVFPTISPTSNSFFSLIFQMDSEPGLAIRGDEDPPGDNYIVCLEMPKDEFTGTNNVKESFLSGVYPNPVSDVANITFNLDNASIVTLRVTSLTGQVVYERNLNVFSKGEHLVNVPVSNFGMGMYLYTLQAGNTISTGKIVVR